MERLPVNSVTRFCVAQFSFVTLLSVLFTTPRWSLVGAAVAQELLRGFTTRPDPSVSSFQALLSDSTGNNSLGFLRVGPVQLSLAVVHVPSSEPLWLANTTSLPRWADATRVVFNGSLLILDPHTGVFWSTNTNGDRVWLANSSNLQIQKLGEPRSILWQSYDFPSDTLMENQNFTSTMSLVSSNGLYSMRLGSDFMALHAKFNQYSDSDQIYWKHKALEAKAEVIEGGGPIYAVVKSDGFLGMYQNGSLPVDVQAFSSFQQSGLGIRRVRIESDGNLKGYYWTRSSWILDYQAISDPCELPSACGLYGLCQPGKGCSCLDERAKYNSGGCSAAEDPSSGDFCSENENKYRVLRRTGVDLPYKQLMGHTKMGTLGQCESACELNCTCWGAVYSNTSGFCYMLYYPLQTLVGVADETKVGYFKVREGARKVKVDESFLLDLGLFLIGGVLIFCGLVGLGWFRFFRGRKRGVRGYAEEEEGVGVGPYKNLGSASFKSIELSEK